MWVDRWFGSARALLLLAAAGRRGTPLPRARRARRALGTRRRRSALRAPFLRPRRNDSHTRVVVPFEAEMEAWVHCTYCGQVAFRRVVMGALPFGEQLRLARGSNVLVGANGAGLWHALLLADEAAVVEVQWAREKARPGFQPAVSALSCASARLPRSHLFAAGVLRRLVDSSREAVT